MAATAPATIPDRFETARLLVRVPRPGDGRALHEAVAESLAQLRAWPASLPWALAEPSIDASETYCRERWLAFHARTDLALLAWRKDDGVLVGATGLHRFDWSVRRFEIGWWLRTGAVGQGLMTEAVRGVVGFAFAQVGAARVEALIDEANRRSRGVAERAGLTLEATHPDERCDPDGTPRTMCRYGLHA